MPSRANSDIDIAARALVLIGAEPITSFSDDTNEGLVSTNVYEDVVQTALCNTRWRFSTNQAELNRLAEAPTSRWDAAYQQPATAIHIHSITINDNRVEYDIYGNKIFCNASVNDTVVCDFTYRASEVNWPPYFVVAVELSLASIFAVSIARDPSLARAYEERSIMAMAKARGLDSQQQTNRKLTTNRFISNRR